ncbi:MAG: hypothetical protein QF440_03815, partial [Candidatus Thalassarchaeaceae archaeon]|nr:hypothetical protein [Candidatus Thalassarchaeaceae archaeon]
IPAPISNRLYQKSALGKPIEGGIILTDEEVMFCHWHRHIPLPEGWVDERLKEDADFAHRAVAFDVVRNAGEKVVPSGERWLRWSRESHPSKGGPEAEVRWARTRDNLDMSELLDWAKSLSEESMLGELAIVDDEMDVTMYRLSIIEPSGNLTPATKSEYPQLGIEHLSRKFLRKDELDWINEVQNPVTDLFGELNSRGLLMRPGFKYGCRWRVYSTSVEEDHAPWLMQMEQDAPSNWEGVCLSVRLAEGVNKGWVIAIKRSSWNFLVISRHLPGR